MASSDGTAEHLEDLVPMLKSRFKKILVRGESAFARQDIFDTCDENLPNEKRKRRKNLRSKRARERDLRIEKQWISEVDY